MDRWVLQEHVWIKVLGEAGFTGISVDMPPSAVRAPRTAVIAGDPNTPTLILRRR